MTNEPPLPLHTLRRIAAEHAAVVDVESPTGRDDVQPVQRISRRERLAIESRAHWLEVRERTIVAIIDLRAEQEPALQSPDLTRAALFMQPRIDEIPSAPEGKPPAPDDRSERAEAWREQWYSRIDALALRRRGSRARQYKPGRIWRNLGSAGERGGKRPGESAWPAAWTAYLMRIDPDGIAGDSWGSPLGVALKRVEAHYANTKLWTALWVYTDPVRPRSMARVQEALKMRQRQAYYWLEAALLRVVAEMQAIGFGPQSARDAYQAAEESEAVAWQNEKEAES